MTEHELSELIKGMRLQVSRLRQKAREADDICQSLYTEASHLEDIANQQMLILKRMHDGQK